MPPPVLVEVVTPVGTARLHLHGAGGAGLLVLGHGAGGGVSAPDLVAVTVAAAGCGWQVALVEQPYRVLSVRRPPPPAATLDAAWSAVLEVLHGRADGRPVVVGGRSSGARVACRGSTTALAATVDGPAGVVALAFPLQPPRGTADRTAELAAVTVPLLVVQGERDPFGTPGQVASAAPRARVHAVAGADHSFVPRVRDGRTAQECADDVAQAVTGFLAELLSRGRAGR